ncbi:MAG: NADH-quinone oxidoreductase subunit C, partial [Terriglobales bacterium]
MPVAPPTALEHLPGVIAEPTRDGIPTFWLSPAEAHATLRALKYEAQPRYEMLYDLTAVDERTRRRRPPAAPALPRSDFTVVYHLYSFGACQYLRLKVPLPDGDGLHLRSITDIWPAANWYECEAWDMFGIRFDGHPHLRRILLPPGWQGHPLRKDHPARATEMGPFRLWEEKVQLEQDALTFHPENWGMDTSRQDTDYLFLNIGPQHPGTHGVLRIVLQ